MYMGSSDWMTRNIYRRIEVCFPVYDENIKQQLKHIIALQLEDSGNTARPQEKIYRFLAKE